MKSVPHPSGMPILFDEKWHQYKMGGVALKSVSKVLDRFFPFDEKRVLALVSKKTGEPESVIREKWNRQALLGKNIHHYIETKLLKQPKPTFSLLLEKKKSPDFVLPKDILHGEEELYLPVAEKAVKVVAEHYDILGVEQIIASPSLGIAGTIDLLARNKTTGKILIGDWKTSGSVRSSFRFGKFESNSMGCLRHLPNAKMYRYALQIAIYGEILRREKYFELGYFDKMIEAAEMKAAESKAKAKGSGKEVVAVKKPKGFTAELEYGLIHMCKEETGEVSSEFVGITESTILPSDRPEMTFHQLLKRVLQGL